MSNDATDMMDSESWGAYRKLITDTLKKLDERTSVLWDQLTGINERVIIIEQHKVDPRLDQLITQFEQFREQYNKDREQIEVIETEFRDLQNTNKGKMYVFEKAWNVIWPIALIIITVALNTVFE